MFFNWYRACLTLLLMAAGFLLFEPFAAAQTADSVPKRQVILVLADRLTESDLQNRNLPNIRSWTVRGGIALMNANVPVDWLSLEGEGLTVLNWNLMKEQRGQSLQGLDNLAGQLLQRANRSTLIILASSGAGLHGQNKELVPILAAGGSIEPGCLLISPSTRRAGVVTSLDVKATVQKFLGVSRSRELAGQAIHSADSGEDPWAALHKIAVQTRQLYAKRTVVITGFAAAGGMLVLLMTGFLFGCFRGTESGWKNKISALLMWGGTAVLVAPFWVLLLPALEWSGNWERLTGWWVWATLVPGAILISARLLLGIRNLLVRLLVLATSTIGLIVADAATGGRLAQHSILSYDPIVGARYYGIGNEYMSLLVSWVLLACGYVLCIRPGWQRWLKLTFPGLGAGLVWLLADPELGANAGGTITAAVAVAVAIKFLFELPGRVSWPLGASIIAGAIALLATLHLGTSSPTHVTQAAHFIWAGEYDRIGELVRGKLLMHLHLIRDYFGAPLVVAVLILATAAVFRPIPPAARFFAKRAGLRPFVNGGVAGSLAGFAANDSGVVVAALLLMPIVYTVCMIKLAEEIPTPHTVVPDAVLHLDMPDWSHGPDPGR